MKIKLADVFVYKRFLKVLMVVTSMTQYLSKKKIKLFNSQNGFASFIYIIKKFIPLTFKCNYDSIEKFLIIFYLLQTHSAQS